jgi:hypothetical protein
MTHLEVTAMRPFQEVLKHGDWVYGIAAEKDAEGDGTWDWQVLRFPIDGSGYELLGMGKAESREEAETLAGVTLQTAWETARH